MIVCSCNVFSDQQVRSALAKATQPLRMSQIYECLGGNPQCGQCAHTIKQIMGRVANRAFVCVAASTNPHTRTRSSATLNGSDTRPYLLSKDQVFRSCPPVDWS
jgi:bacterioferritin-associated ferredoxin